MDILNTLHHFFAVQRLVIIIAVSLYDLIPPKLHLVLLRSILTRRRPSLTSSLVALALYLVLRNHADIAVCSITFVLPTVGIIVIELEDKVDVGQDEEEEADVEDEDGGYSTLRIILQGLLVVWVLVNSEPELKCLERSQWNGMEWWMSGLLLLLIYHTVDFVSFLAEKDQIWNVNAAERNRVVSIVLLNNLVLFVSLTVVFLSLIRFSPASAYLFVAVMSIAIVVVLKNIRECVRNRPPSVTCIRSLPRASAEQLAVNDDVCLVCHEEMDSACVTPCKHFYHANCLNDWLRRDNRCPMCQHILYQK